MPISNWDSYIFILLSSFSLKKLTGEEMRANFSTQEMTDLGSNLLASR